MKMKKFVSIALVAALVFSLCANSAYAINVGQTNVSAERAAISSDKIIELPYCPVGETIRIPVGDAEYIDDGTGNLIKISDLMSFSSQRNAANYIDIMSELLQPPVQYKPDINYATKATHGDALVASQSIGGLSTVSLRVAYTTSGNSNTGTITYHAAYTTFTGFTLGFGWDEKNCYSQVTSSGKAIYAKVTGELVYNLLVDGFIEIGRRSITLDGTCFAVR